MAKKREDEMIDRLTGEEKNRAFSELPTGLLRSRLEKKIRAEMEKESCFRFWLLKPLPLIATVFLTTFIGVILYSLISPSPSVRRMPIFEQALQLAPGIQTLTNRLDEIHKESSHRDENLPSPAGNPLTSSPFALIFSLHGQSSGPPPGLSTPSREDQPVFLNIQRKIEMLIRERIIYHSLEKMMDSPKKEERNG